MSLPDVIEDDVLLAALSLMGIDPTNVVQMLIEENTVTCVSFALDENEKHVFDYREGRLALVTTKIPVVSTKNPLGVDVEGILQDIFADEDEEEDEGDEGTD